MIFKPGDIVVWKLKNKEVYLILETNLEKEEYRLFVLKYSYKGKVGKQYDIPFDNIENKNYILLKDKTW